LQLTRSAACVLKLNDFDGLCCLRVCVKRHLLEFGENVPFDCSEAKSQGVGCVIDNSKFC
jgi:hypothetical protein